MNAQIIHLDIPCSNPSCKGFNYFEDETGFYICSDCNTISQIRCNLELDYTFPIRTMKSKIRNNEEDEIISDDGNIDDNNNIELFSQKYSSDGETLMNISTTNIKSSRFETSTFNDISSLYSRNMRKKIILAKKTPQQKLIEIQDNFMKAPGIVQYALDKLEQFGYVPETKQLINSEILKEECESRVGICIIAFLPHIADSSAKERNRYLDIIKEARKGNRGKPIYYLWAQGGDYFDFEDKLHLSFGYPAVIAVNYKKKMYSICRSSFSKENLVDFVSNLLNGKEHLSKLPDGIKIKKVDKWDGKDYVPPKEEDDL